ncbi:Major Facilitator Superfamily protein [Caloranaerobacter azorensis DSM 13643]|uniref:Major Facilitator Superfamily protein n=1 Tax=Caloranaerobacter azorensis DSM 13643 TaxID=1121264 RepID=A0A1M5U4G1_9FIRM|nr:MFS transporter [Caloranaerobacter azorensis]SHH57770.1 Major Facilitator Superfamily protein [Caloranaerobacter azorensis DSM 13643]
MQNVYAEIKKDKQIWKFCFYGFLKNLKFFEPYLYIYLLANGLSLFKVGVLFAIREIVTYIFEVPSGIFADSYGKKTELLICFTFYIISFIFFFLSTNYMVIVIAMIFFGLGEAFRSGTHKAMIYSYLEQKGWFSYKGFVYGRTRSFSLLGSSISAFLSIIFVLKLPAMRWIFLICILPYILDFLLILSYPNSLNEKNESDLSIKKFFVNSFIKLKSIFSNEVLMKVLISSSLYDGIFKTIKDYIQPILQTTILLMGASYIVNLDSDSQIKVILGITYGIFYIFSSMASRNIYKLNKYLPSSRLMQISFDIMGILSVVLYFAIKFKLIYLVVGLYFVLYVLKDGRRPLVVDVCGDYMNKNERATVMSIDSQLKSLFVVILAPLFGFIADKFSIQVLFLIIGISMLIINRLLNLANDSEYISTKF